MTFRHIHHLSPELQDLLETSMSLLADKLAALETKVDAAVAVIEDLKAKLAAALSSDEVIADEAKADSIAAKLDAVLPPPAPEPTPTPPGPAST